MNVETIFRALEEDCMNSGLGIICAELENQGYIVSINDNTISSDEIIEGKYKELENNFESLNIILMKNNQYEQSFSLKFVDFHKIVIEK